MIERAQGGWLFIGDPHLASRVPGFRRDDYPRAILKKLSWCFDYARENALRPVLLGDVFHWPRDNANWLLASLMRLIDEPVACIAGNHDCRENGLDDDDSLSLLALSGCVTLLGPSNVIRERFFGRDVILGGSPWGEPLPDEETVAKLRAGDSSALVAWVTHHDLAFEGYAGEPLVEIPGVDVVVNGHVHRPLPSKAVGETTYHNPGNISRLNRGDREPPSVLALKVSERCVEARSVVVPHVTYDDAFHPALQGEDPLEVADSLFVHGLGELEARRTRGAGLREFLDRNLDQFDDRVAQEIQGLAREVLADDDIGSS